MYQRVKGKRRPRWSSTPTSPWGVVTGAERSQHNLGAVRLQCARCVAGRRWEALPQPGHRQVQEREPGDPGHPPQPRVHAATALQRQDQRARLLPVMCGMFLF